MNLVTCTYSGAYLGFEIAGANLKILVFLIDRFLYTVSYKPILSTPTNMKEYSYVFEPND